jgi:hypothetical protein
MLVGEFPETGDEALLMLRNRAGRMTLGGVSPDNVMESCKLIYRVWISFSRDFGVHHHWEVEEAIRKGIWFATGAYDLSDDLFKGQIMPELWHMRDELQKQRAREIHTYVNLEIDFWLGDIGVHTLAIKTPGDFADILAFADDVEFDFDDLLED